ncbi:MAG TPA: glycosyltransferase family 1 protein, partial [Candidatus Pacebacteria bacterium]|nr:glycosyltransferase family 1 protein [Candidatus Paceibacterota bacterium]
FEEIQKYYDKAKLFVNTSDHEGFPNSFVQACLGSTPIVSYKVNPDNFLVKRNVGYFADGDRAKLFELVQDGLKNEMIWKDKSKNCFKYVKKYHDLKKNCRMWDKEINLIIQ